eukprot:TRINITY_DN11827_c0_g1_i1.p1 TRINITY_DN11827_c0_g1~~TRINITY_DN11827_c0_g1_i1.p1  ORF type:complete len:107 (+),score=3.02 TRINITY_DN11827_c0_g1_i1:1292-1612(+)
MGGAAVSWDGFRFGLTHLKTDLLLFLILGQPVMCVDTVVCDQYFISSLPVYNAPWGESLSTKLLKLIGQHLHKDLIRYSACLAGRSLLEPAFSIYPYIKFSSPFLL